MTGRLSRLAPLTGVVFVVLLVIAFIVGGEPPDVDDTSEEVVSFYTENDSDQIVSAILSAYALLFFLFFAGTLRAALRRGEEAPGVLSAIAFGGALLAAVGGLIFSGLTFTLGDAADDLDPAAVQALHALNLDLFLPLAVGTGAFLIASGIAIVRGATLYPWLGWVGIVIGIAAVTPIGFFAFLAMLAWVLVASISLAMAAGAERAAPPGAL